MVDDVREKRKREKEGGKDTEGRKKGEGKGRRLTVWKEEEEEGVLDDSK